jgi:hypothetical protein
LKGLINIRDILNKLARIYEEDGKCLYKNDECNHDKRIKQEEEQKLVAKINRKARKKNEKHKR